MKIKLPSHVELDATEFDFQIARSVSKAMGIPYTEHKLGVKLYGCDLVLRLPINDDNGLDAVKMAAEYMGEMVKNSWRP